MSAKVKYSMTNEEKAEYGLDFGDDENGEEKKDISVYLKFPQLSSFERLIQGIKSFGTNQ